MFNLFETFKKKEDLEDKIKKFELEAIMENVRDGVVIYDTNFRILSMNRSAEKIFNLKAEEILGERIEPDMIKNPRLRILAQTVFPSLAPAMTTVSGDGWPQIIDLAFENPRLELRTALNRIVNDKNEVAGFLKIITDTTREKDIVESKTEFVSVAAHQLRTPLTAINWSFERLNKILAEKNSDLTEAVEIVRGGWQLAQRSIRIVNDLLNAARIESGRFGFKFEEVNLLDFISKIIGEVGPVAKEYGVRIDLISPKGKYPVWIDQELLGTAITNLLDNGLKYNTKNGTITIAVEPDSTPGFLKIEIRDTGVGIPAEELPKIFQKFYRGENAIQMEPNGSGLGLYIAKNIIERHGGKISLESRLGRGTILFLTLPLIGSSKPEKPAIKHPESES